MAPHDLGTQLAGYVDWNNRSNLEVEVPAGNGVGTARAIARAYSAFAEGGAELGITPDTMARLTAPPPTAVAKDEVLGVPSYFALGYLRPVPGFAFASSARAFGTPGVGGSFGFADPDVRLGYAYVMNKMCYYLNDDPREGATRRGLPRATCHSLLNDPQTEPRVLGLLARVRDTLAHTVNEAAS